MVEVIYLASHEQLPDFGDDQRWLTVEAADDGRFFGTGGSWKTNGEWVGYGSIAEDDPSLETALAAAKAWAEKYQVPTIWIQLVPQAR